jgi:hypothetical protein
VGPRSSSRSGVRSNFWVRFCARARAKVRTRAIARVRVRVRVRVW